MILKIISSQLVINIGFSLKSDILLSTVTLTFFSQFINTAVILLAANGQQFTDFTSQWYVEVGSQFVFTMAIESMVPYIDFIISYGLKTVYRI